MGIWRLIFGLEQLKLVLSPLWESFQLYTGPVDVSLHDYFMSFCRWVEIFPAWQLNPPWPSTKSLCLPAEQQQSSICLHIYLRKKRNQYWREFNEQLLPGPCPPRWRLGVRTFSDSSVKNRFQNNVHRDHWCIKLMCTGQVLASINAGSSYIIWNRWLFVFPSSLPP